MYINSRSISLLNLEDIMVIFYSTHCPKCTILEKKLKDNGIEYTEINDPKIMLDKGFLQVPMLEVDGQIFDFNGAIRWIATK